MQRYSAQDWWVHGLAVFVTFWLTLFIILMFATDCGWKECILIASVADVFGCLVLGTVVLVLGLVLQLVWGPDENVVWLTGLGVALCSFAFLVVAVQEIMHRR